jgi:hypothetical protein
MWQGWDSAGEFLLESGTVSAVLVGGVLRLGPCFLALINSLFADVTPGRRHVIDECRLRIR